MTDQERAILALEGLRWERAGAKETAIAERTGLTPVRYYQLVTRLIDREDALAHDPLLVNRLRRQVAARRDARALRRAG